MKIFQYSPKKIFSAFRVVFLLSLGFHVTEARLIGQESEASCPYGMARWFDFFEEVEDMGGEWGRIRIFWKHIEAVDDVFRFGSVDESLDSMESHGMEAVLLVRLGELEWATEGNLYGERYDNGSFLPLDLSQEWDADYGYSQSYYDFVYNLVSHVCGRVNVIVVENEANSLKFFYGEWRDYLKILKTAYKAAHDACPGIVVTNSGLASGLFGWCIVSDMIASGEYSDAEICEFATGYYRRSSRNGSYVFTGPNGMERIAYRLEQNARDIAFADSLVRNMGGWIDAYNFHFYEDYEYMDDVIGWVDAKMGEGGYEVDVKLSNEMGIRNRNEEYDRESVDHAQDVVKKMVQAVRCGLKLFCWFPMSDGFEAGERWMLTSDKIGLGDGYPKKEGGGFEPRYAAIAYSYVTSLLGSRPVFEREDNSVANIVHWELLAAGEEGKRRVTALWWDDGYGGSGSSEVILDIPQDVFEIVIRRFPDVEIHVDPEETDWRILLTVDQHPTFVTYVLEPTAIDDGGENLHHPPRVLSLQQNYPNPFNPITTITFSIDGEAGSETRASLSVYNGRGIKVRTLVDDSLAPGRYDVIWDGKNERGVSLPSGVYIYRLRAGGESATRKLVLLR
ncbi:MAG: T9SS type A sorting domain-containing protein [Candidatus Glassbacteria bacterium]